MRGAGGEAFVSGTDITQFLDFRDGEDGVAYERRIDEGITLVDAGEGFPVEILVVEELGSDAFAYGRLVDAAVGTVLSSDQTITLRVDARKPPAKGAVVHVQIRPEEEHVFSAENGERVGADER